MIGFSRVIAALEQHYGRPKPPLARGPFELILYENIAYLVSEDRREKAFRELRARIGTRPEDILVASLEELAAITALGGIFPELRARRLQESARLVRDEFRGDLRSVLTLDFVKARKALRKFPTIGEPGAEKILLFTEAHASLALESNGVRVLVRIGFAEEHKSYSTTYRHLQNALRDQIGSDCAPLVSAHQLLKLHGQELCRRSEPRCTACPIRATCAFVIRPRIAKPGLIQQRGTSNIDITKKSSGKGSLR
jgi:endonuclease-3